MSKKLLLGLLLMVAAIGGYLGYQYYLAQQTRLPVGIASGNGRIEAKQVDVSAKESLRVKEILVREGDLVEPGQVLVRMDTATLESQLAEAKASMAASQERVAVASSAIVRQQSLVDNAKVELERTKKLLADNAASEREYDARKTNVAASEAGLAEEQAKLQTAKQEVVVAQANVHTIQTRIDDATLTAPVRGRVLYRLAEVGEVLSPGGKALTLVNLEDVYMEIFLPAESASRLRVGSEARLTVDHRPGYSAAGFVSFVSPEAQFTPKQVETKSERDKLMFRVKIQVPEELVSSIIEQIKTGVRGVGYVKYEETAAWPEWLEHPVTPEFIAKAKADLEKKREAASAAKLVAPSETPAAKAVGAPDQPAAGEARPESVTQPQ
jgi:HlyD family secretion protein